MHLRRLHDDLLAQTGYLVGCDETGIAIAVDPGRDIDRYIEAAAHEKLKIAFVTETHIHADFVSGARALARATSAELILSDEGGPDWRYEFAAGDGARLVHDGDEIDVGRVRLAVRHTPGHTPEHISFVVSDRGVTDAPLGMLSGDFIFVGDVGRPDLLERAAKVAGSTDTLARQLFRSVRATKALPDHLQIWPGHGAGSACGKALGAMPSTTLGYERLVNWAFQIDDEDRFVREALAGQVEPPRYFARMKQINRDGPPVERPSAPLPELDLAVFERAVAAGASIVDARSTADFAAGHIPGSLALPLGNSFATWAGWLLPDDRDVVVLGDEPARVASARLALSFIGIDRVIGWGGAALRRAWSDQKGPLSTTTIEAIDSIATPNHRAVIDVRNSVEWSAGHVPHATHYFLGDLLDLTRDLPRDAPIAVHCQGGTRSAIAASLLERQGFTDVVNIKGGFHAWEDAGLPIARSNGPE